MSTNNTKLETIVNDLTKSIESKHFPTSFPNEEPLNGHAPSVVAVDVVNELHSRERRKCNVVVHNLPEPTDPQENQNDVNTFLEICQSVLNVEVELVKCYRLGKKQNSRPRSLLIQLKDELSRNLVLSNAPNLHFNETCKHIYIQQDLTPTEWAAHKRLYEELKRCRSHGENNLIMRNGRIVPYTEKFPSRVWFNYLPNTSGAPDLSASNTTCMDLNPSHDNPSSS